MVVLDLLFREHVLNQIAVNLHSKKGAGTICPGRSRTSFVPGKPGVLHFRALVGPVLEAPVFFRRQGRALPRTAIANVLVTGAETFLEMVSMNAFAVPKPHMKGPFGPYAITQTIDLLYNDLINESTGSSDSAAGTATGRSKSQQGKGRGH